MKIVLLLSQELKQRFVIRELSRRYTIAGIVIEDKYTPARRVKTILKNSGLNPLKLAMMMYKKLIMSRYDARDSRTINRYFLEQGAPIVIDRSMPLIEVPQINSPESRDFIKKISPELIVAFGTSLVKEEIADVPSRGIINVHTGLAPYYRGGQSAFWCLYNDEPEYIGVTIHWLTQGIDSGDIILQGRPEIQKDDTLISIECKLAKLAVELLLKAIGKISEGTAEGVKQTAKGRFYLSKQFTLEKRLAVEKRLKEGLLARYLERKDSVYNKVGIEDD